MFTPKGQAERIGWSLWRVVRCARFWSFKNAYGSEAGCIRGAGPAALAARLCLRAAAASGGATNSRRGRRPSNARGCGHQESVTAGTIFQRTRTLAGRSMGCAPSQATSIDPS